MDITLVNNLNEILKVPVKKYAASEKIGFLSEAALRAVLLKPDTSTVKGIRDIFYMILLYDSGARNHEILDLKVKDIDFTPGSCKITVTGKGNKRRTLQKQQPHLIR